MPPALRSLLTLAVVAVIYFAFPVGKLPSAVAAVVSIVGLVVGGVVLAALIVTQIRRQIRAGSDQSVRAQSLLTLLSLTVLVFSLGYFALADATEAQFAGLDTKVDALYFTVTTLATVGFGDVHPTGQLARGLVTAQIVFNLVFVGALAAVLTARMRHRAAAKAAHESSTSA